MKKIYKTLWQSYKSLVLLCTSATLLALFSLWYPDFIVWYSRKIAGIELSFMFEVIPLFIFAGGLSIIVLFLFKSICAWKEHREVLDE